MNELIWREFYTQVLHNFPHVTKGAFRPEYDKLQWSDNQEHFAAWCEGRTGYPIVDAAMRCLNATGTMHNRLRMIVAMFLTKDLLINWQWGERYFMKQLVDGDMAANNGGWQWSAGTGTDAAPYFRIFNPVSQGEKLPAITTITLALGMQRMARRGALVRKLAAVETLGSATVICSDKTGTLTQNAMSVREVFAGGTTYAVDGAGYEPTGTWTDAGGAPVTAFDGPLRQLLATAALCNDARLVQTDAGFRVVGDPTEGALLALAARAGMPREELVSSQRVVKEMPFDSDRKRMTTVTLGADGREVAHTKGSADVLLPLCIMQEGAQGPTPLDEAGRQAILREVERMSDSALRVLAIARRELRDGMPEEGLLEERLTFLGLVGMLDAPRPGVKEAVRACADAFVRAVMITGDHKLTAVAIARELGLWSSSTLALTGADLEALSDEELDACVRNVSVFARVTARQKLRIVRSLKRQGEVVAMTGDGVNDAPALREADIGVAMGQSGTDVAREAADMVIADDNFASIVEAVREGRAIYKQHPEVHLLPPVEQRRTARRGLLGVVHPGICAADAAHDPVDQPRHQRPAGARPWRGPARLIADARGAASPVVRLARHARVPGHSRGRRLDGRRCPLRLRVEVAARDPRLPEPLPGDPLGPRGSRRRVLSARAQPALPRRQLPLGNGLAREGAAARVASPGGGRRAERGHPPRRVRPGAPAHLPDVHDERRGVGVSPLDVGVDRAGVRGVEALAALAARRAGTGREHEMARWLTRGPQAQSRERRVMVSLSSDRARRRTGRRTPRPCS